MVKDGISNNVLAEILIRPLFHCLPTLPSALFIAIKLMEPLDNPFGVAGDMYIRMTWVVEEIKPDKTRRGGNKNRSKGLIPSNRLVSKDMVGGQKGLIKRYQLSARSSMQFMSVIQGQIRARHAGDIKVVYKS